MLTASLVVSLEGDISSYKAKPRVEKQCIRSTNNGEADYRVGEETQGSVLWRIIVISVAVIVFVSCCIYLGVNSNDTNDTSSPGINYSPMSAGYPFVFDAEQREESLLLIPFYGYPTALDVERSS